MASWDVVNRDVYNRFLIIMEMLEGDGGLLEYLFDPDEAELRCNPSEIIKNSRGYSSGQRVMIRVALDIWSGSGDTKLFDVIEGLDEDRFRKIVRGLLTSRGLIEVRQSKLPTFMGRLRQ